MISSLAIVKLYSKIQVAGLLLLGLRANGLLLAFTGAGIRAGTLATDRKAAAVALTAIAVDGGQTLENGLLFTTKVTFNQDSVSGDHLNNLRELFVGKLSRTDVGIDACLFQDSLRSRVPDSVNIRKGSLDALLVGYFCTEKACHNGLDLLAVIFLCLAQSYCLGQDGYHKLRF